MFYGDLTHRKLQKSQTVKLPKLMHIAFELGGSGICTSQVMANFVQI